MEADFSIAVDPLRRLLRITMSGFFSPADVRRFAEARAAAHARLRCGAKRHIALVDIRGMKIQSREIVDAFAAILSDPAFHARRLAFVVDRGLARSQIQRAAGGRGAGFFTDEVAAMAWLMVDEAADPLPPARLATGGSAGYGPASPIGGA